MRVNEFRELGSEDLQTRLDEVKEEFFNLRFQNATGQLENYKQLGQIKRDIARIETVIKERALGIEIEPKDLPPPKPRKQKGEEEEEEVVSESADELPVEEEEE